MMKWDINVELIDANGEYNPFILAEDVYNSDESLIAPKGTPVTKKIKNLMQSHKKRYIQVEMQADVLQKSITETSADEFKLFKVLYDNMEQETVELFNGVLEKEPFCIDKAFSIVNSLAGSTGSLQENLSFIYSLRELDYTTYSHSVNVGVLCNILGRWLGYSEEEIMLLTVSGLMHDIGKIETPIEILDKPGKLTEEEFDIVKLHVIKGYDLLAAADAPYEVRMAALTHHEKLDGSGYMYGLNSESIHKFSKIVSLCDIYDAMVSKRVYKQKRCPLGCIVSMESNMHESLSLEYMYVFKQRLIETFVGRQVILNNGAFGEIMFIDSKHPTRPLIKTDSDVISLKENENLHMLYVA
jgi:putative nucleotidyltransferase with HDIG domain